MDKVFEQVVILLAMMAVGFVAAKARIITENGRNLLTKLVLYVTQPFLIINSFQMAYSADVLMQMGIVAVFAVLSMGGFYLLGSFALPRKDDGKRRVLWQSMVFSNCGFMGIPVLGSLFGDAGVIYASVYILVFTVFTWTLGIYIYAGKTGSWREVLLQPGLIAVIVGLVLFLTGVRLPEWAVKDIFSQVGSLTTPLAMMIVGALVAEGDFRSVFRDLSLFGSAAIRLVALPALSLGMFWLLHSLGLPGLPAAGSPVVVACVLITAMPVAANVAIFASMYSVRPQYAAQTVVVSTLLSVATVPLWMFVLRMLS